MATSAKKYFLETVDKVLRAIERDGAGKISELLQDPDVIAGRLDTKLIERRMSERAAVAASAA